MAYVIGSDKGKDIAKKMKTGETYKASDGSTWTKKSDGSVSVTTKSGEKFDNAYKAPSVSTVSSGGGTSGGSAYKPTKNSQYTKPVLGNTWDANTDYQAIINNAVANGDYVTAAKAEQLRNQKIIQTGANYDRTSKYGGSLDGSGIDWGTVGTNQMNAGVSAEDVLATYYQRYGKAMNTEGLQGYANDELQQAMWQYAMGAVQKNNQPEDFEYTKKKPTEPERDPRIDALLNEILNRDDFSYDAASDPLYQQYANMYRREGDRAMRETLAEAAAGAGGMNTYAITAAQQANNYYNSQLNDKIPELYQLAYSMYLNDKESKMQDLGILQDMDESQYNRYRDTVNDWYADKNFAYGVYRDDVQDGQWQTQFDYNAMIDNRNLIRDDIWKNKQWNYQLGRDQLADSRYEKEWDYQVGRDQISDSQYNDELSYNRGQDSKKSAEAQMEEIIKTGTMPRDELIAQAGWNKADVEVRVKARQAELGISSGGGNSKNSGGSGGYAGGNTPVNNKAESEVDTSDYTLNNFTVGNRVYVDGIGHVSYQDLLAMRENGTVIEEKDSKNKTLFYRKA